ncbi:MAG: hypothetical protein RMK97_02035 [Sutterellaceae bacterium]|nr:hypothetical protein [Burkholderiaceae bacterium]MDW8429274.1 hypothetical protein [Sutterellaceae bacterium]
MPVSIERNPTLLDVVDDLARVTGFSNALTDAAGSTDPAVGQFVAAANYAARELLQENVWPHLIREHTITVQAATPGQAVREYDLPEDFYSLVLQTGNDGTNQVHAFGPLSPAVWQSIRTLSPLAPGHNLMWRLVGETKIAFLYPPSSPTTFRFEYLSQAYVQDADDLTLFKNIARKNGDRFLFDETLIKLLARVKWLETKGFDAGAATADYQRALQARVRRLDGAQVLSMIGPLHRAWMPWDDVNIPRTGVGS